MSRTFPQTLAALRKEKNISQRCAAQELGISQALLSHYETGTREPGLNFVCRACDYYGVTADYLLCRSEEPGRDGAGAAKVFLRQMRAMIDKAEMVLEDMDGENK